MRIMIVDGQGGGIGRALAENVRAALPEAEIVVDASCTAGPDPDLHAKGLDVMEALQITVLNR